VSRYQVLGNRKTEGESSEERTERSEKEMGGERMCIPPRGCEKIIVNLKKSQ
jgi:hypothetical protein